LGNNITEKAENQRGTADIALLHTLLQEILKRAGVLQAHSNSNQN
jgi:hypothetical protein